MNVFLVQILSLFIFFSACFLYAVIKKRNDIADVAWGLGFLIIAIIGAFYNPTPKTLIIAILVFIWGSRLAFHIGKRFLNKKEEDHRYQKMRDSWKGSQNLNSWVRVFMLQGMLLVFVSTSVIIVTKFDQGGFTYINIIGGLIWLFGFCFEVIGDRQLKKFIAKRENSREIMTKGLWKYTRHPNYFGEAVLWWGIFIMTWGVEYFWLGILSPLTITILLRFVSGVPMAEQRYQDNKEFREYAKKTPAMVPNFFIK